MLARTRGLSAGTDRRLAITRAARALLEREGHGALTMRRLAAELGIQAPSLYRHFPDKSALEAALATEASAELGRMIALWARERGCDLARIARGYRRFAQERRHLLPLLVPNE